MIHPIDHVHETCSIPDGIKYNQSLPYVSEVPSHFDDRKAPGSVFIFESVPKTNQSFKVEVKIWDGDNMLAFHVLFDVGRVETKTSGTNDYIVITTSLPLWTSFFTKI